MSYYCAVLEPVEVVFVHPLEGEILLNVGQRHVMECVAKGQPEPQYVWLKDNNIISEGNIANASRYCMLLLPVSHVIEVINIAAIVCRL